MVFLLVVYSTSPPGVNQVDGLPPVSNWLRSGRACERKIYKKMYTFDEVIVEKLIANYRKVASYYNKAVMEGI